MTEQIQVKPVRWWRVGALILLLILIAIALLLGYRFLQDEPVTYDDPVEHFKYGSTGGERNLGFPYWVWRSLPKVCADHLPGEGYESLGMLFEPGEDLPVGTSKRRHLGIDRVFLNCAVCHVSTVRTAPDAEPMLVAGMPAATLNLMAFQQFFLDCVSDARFTPERIVPEIQSMGAGLDLLDRYLVYPVAIHLMRDRVFSLIDRLRFFQDQPEWGPGRVDTFNSAKAIFNFPIEDLPDEELIGTSDFPSIWSQEAKRGMQLHWDGNNDKVEERNLSAAFGTGATPPIADHAAIGRVEDWIAKAEPPEFAKHFAVDQGLAAEGEGVYGKYCAECHGASGTDFSGERVGRVTPLAEVGTDPFRLQSYTPALMVNQGTLYAGYEDYRFTRFRKTFGYANMPLDGLWLRAPYLHNGSVPSLWDLLQPAANRPTAFHRGNDLYDPIKLGFVSDVPEEAGKRYFLFDTRLKGNANSGHEGEVYGTHLPEDRKWALIEYLKTF